MAVNEVSRGELYPDRDHEIIREAFGLADEFDILREELLLDYGYQTARAYWGDLEHWRGWCEAQEPSIDPLQVRTADVETYLAWLKEMDYSPNTRARRLTTLRAFYLLVETDTPNPTLGVAPISRRKTRAEYTSE